MDADGHPGAGVALRGAPDEYIGEKHVPKASRWTPVMQVEMTRDVIDEMLASIREGRAPSIQFGQNPILKVGESTRMIEASKEQFRNELYTTDIKNARHDNGSGLSFSGLVDYRLAMQNASAISEVTGKADAALQSLKDNIAALRREKEAKVTFRTDTVDRVQDSKKRIAAGKTNRGPVLSSKLAAHNSSSAPSPALSATSPKPTAPTAAAYSRNFSDIQEAIRVPLLHLLAVKPAKLQRIIRQIHAPAPDVKVVLEKIGKEQGGEWKLSDKMFKELDVFDFPYRSKEERQQVIDNAIRALDRQRLDPTDKIWQKFLPEEERGKGKTLSKLSLGAPAAAQKPATPNTMKPTQRLKSLTKKVEPKKKEPRKKKTEEESTGLAGRTKPPKGSVGEEKDVTMEKKKPTKATSDEDRERPTASKAIKRPITENKEDGQGPAKKLKRAAQDEKEPATQGAKKKLPPKASIDASKDVSINSQQKVARLTKDGMARAGGTAAPTKSNKEGAQQEPKGTAKLTKKPQQAANGIVSANGLNSATSKKVINKANDQTKAHERSKINDQKASEPNGKTVQPKINGLPFTSTKKVSSVKAKNASSAAASPLATSETEKSRPIHKASPAGASTPGIADRIPKRKAVDLDHEIHKHDVPTKQRKTTHSTPLANVSTTTNTPSSAEKVPLKRRADDLDSDKKQPPAKKLVVPHKASKPMQTPTPNYSGTSSISPASSQSQNPNTGHARQHDSPQSLHDVSSVSPEQDSRPLNVRRALELSTQFKRCYAKYHALYTSIANRHGQPPTAEEREDIRRQEAVLAGMKRQIKWLTAHPEG